MRRFNFLLAILFLVFAFIQINDPDGAYWILIYGFVSVICILAIFKFYPVKIIGAGVVVFVIYMAFLFPAVLDWLGEEDKSVFFDQMQTEKPFIEESREFFGLLLAVLTLLFHLFSKRYYQKQAGS